MRKIVIGFLCLALLMVNGTLIYGIDQTYAFADSVHELSIKSEKLNEQYFKLNNEEINELTKIYVYLDKDMKVVVAKKIEDLKKTDSYNSTNKNVSVRDIVNKLKQNGIQVNGDLYEICLQIEEFKKVHPESDAIEIVRYIDRKAGLVEDPQGLISYLFSNNHAQAISYTDWTQLTASEKLLIASNPINALYTDACKQKAFNLTTAKYGNNGLGDQSDGYRHAVWNALMTRDINKTWAEMYATAHEDKPSSVLSQLLDDGFSGYAHKNMDLHNNMMGRSVIYWNELYSYVSDAQIKSRINNLLTNTSSGIIWLHK